MAQYWWDGDERENVWMEIRREPGIGKDAWAYVLDKTGRRDGRRALVAQVRPGDVVVHYDARQSRYVGWSKAAQHGFTNGDIHEVPLAGFTPFERIYGQRTIVERRDELFAVRDDLQARHPGASLYLPFQFTQMREKIRPLPNYFAKLPVAAAAALFDEDWIERAPSPDSGSPLATTTYLRPFLAKADTNYAAYVAAQYQERTRPHETLVNDAASWLRAMGYEPARNAVVDLAVEDPMVLIEAKSIRDGGWRTAIRQAVAQLYEYRYFSVRDATAPLILLVDQQPPKLWLEYLEGDRGIGALWRSGSGFAGSPLAHRFLPHPRPRASA